jgi:hypothetical protein
MSMLNVDGVVIPPPSSLTWGLQDVSGSDAGRTQDPNATMQKNRITQKRKLSLVWNNPDKNKTSQILKAFNPEYIHVTYHDAMDNVSETREFYVGDRTAPTKMWTIDKKIYSQVSFDIIER